MEKRGDADGCDSTVTLPSVSMPISHYVDELFKKGASKREDALASIIRIFSSKMQTEFVEKNFATLLYRFLNSIKKGSARERGLASNALGLLAMTIHSRDKAQETYNESTPLLTKALNSSSNHLMVLDSLAVVTFFCAENSDEVEKIMQIIWGNIHQESDSTGTTKVDWKIGLISAWSFLLSSLDGWRLSCKYWKGAVSYFSSLEDEVLRDVALEALTLIHEMGSPSKFSGDLAISKSRAVEDSCLSPESSSLKEESNEEIHKLVTSGVSDSKSDALKYAQVKDFGEKSVRIGKQTLILSTFAQVLQLKFIKKFLGREGFGLHIRENELFQDVFEFMIKKQDSGCKLYVSEQEKLVKCYLRPRGIPSGSSRDDMLPFINRKDKAIHQRLHKSSNSPLSKTRTQLMNKKRMQSQERNVGHFISGD
ncbi:hypothetical protein SAY87_018754 [Trapa incisa]|uniref:Interferon-related developmental regulator N-terminal domain-containing protein n=1 Tax=Trapa incisa TaxID=236973 RepID=A0AAN7JY38_9MYRT|nr:hypothetical protein SAY87_018754 [Trapa incisa]